jgi:hypothetical protein
VLSWASPVKFAILEKNEFFGYLGLAIFCFLWWFCTSRDPVISAWCLAILLGLVLVCLIARVLL